MKGDKMEERTGIITMRGNPLTLVGRDLKVGDTAPDCEVLDNDPSPIFQKPGYGWSELRDSLVGH